VLSIVTKPDGTVKNHLEFKIVSPILPSPSSKEYNDLVEALYFTNEFKRRGGRASLFRWGITTSEQLQELKALGKDVGIDRFVTTFSYPGDYSIRRESAIGNY
jgi:hypothetical protein